MADRYWVGGSGDWYDTNRWAATSGGTPGASVPTFSDNVFIDANSSTGSTIVISQTWVAETNDFTIDGVGQDIVFSVTQAYDYQFTALTTRGNVYWTNNVSWGSFAFRGFYVDFQASASTSKTVTITSTISGTFDVAFTSNASATLGLNITNWGTRARHGVVFQGSGTINLNASVIRGSSVSFANGLTVNAGTSTTGIINGDGNIIYSYTIGATCNFNPDTATTQVTSGAIRTRLNLNGKSIYNFVYDGNTNSANFGLGYYVDIQTAAVVLNNFTVDCATNSKFILMSNNLTIGGTFSVINTVPQSRWCLMLPSSTFFAWELILNGSTNLTDWWMSGVYVRGSAAPISGTRLGNLGRNRGINFGSRRTVYRIGTGNWNDNQWSNTSGGSPNVNFIPLPQDIAVYDQNTATGTQNINGTYVSSIDASARTTALTLTFQLSNGSTYYGGIKLGSGITIGSVGSGSLSFAGDDLVEIDLAGKTFGVNITVSMIGGTFSLLSSFVTTGTFTLTYGTVDTKNYNLTASALIALNNNVRSFKLGSSTVTLTGTSPLQFTNGTFPTIRNLTFDAGTSTIICNTASGFTFAGEGLTYYNVSFTGTAAVGIGISGANTFNNLSITAPSAAGIKTVSISGNQIINGTFTVSGGAGNQRTLLFSNTLGTPRTLTANAISWTDVDFRDITLAGTATGSSPTRAGDWGGNTGITFPAPKTVYWNLAGSQNWNANGWAATSGGSPSTDNFPLAQDTAVFNNSGSADTITLLPTYATSAIDMSARSTAMTITTSTNTVEIYGNWSFGSGVTSSSTTGVLTFVKRGTQTITSNGQTFGCPITIGSGTVITSTVVQLADAITLESTKTLNLAIGTFDAVSYNVTTGVFNTLGNTNTRTLKLGSGTWSITGTGTCWDVQGLALAYDVPDTLALFLGTAEIILSNNTTTARTFNGGSFQYGKVTIGGTSSTSTTTINGNNSFVELASTKTVAHTIAFGDNTTQYIKTFSVSGSSGNVVTLNRTSAGVWNLVLFGRTSGIDYLNVNNCTVSTTSPAEFYAGANSTNTGGNTRVVFTAAPASRTLYWVGGTGNWSDSARWSLSSGGAGGQAQPTSVDNVIFDAASNATGYTFTIDSSLGARCRTFSLGAPASGIVTWAGTQPMFLHNNVSFPGGANITASHSGTFYLCGTTSGYTLDPNGVVIGGSLVGYGLDAEWTLLGAVNLGFPSGIYIVYGTFNTNSYNVTVFQFWSDASTIGKSGISLGASVCSMYGFTMFNICYTVQSGTTRVSLTPSPAKLAVFTFDAGTSTLIGTLSGDTTDFAGAGKTFYNVSHTDTFGRTKRFRGANTYNTFTVCNRGTTQFLDSGSVIGTLIANGISATSRPRVEAGGRSTATASPFSSDTPITLIVNSLTTSFCDFRAINLTGAAAPANITSGGNLGNNTGFTFASKTVYRVGTNTTWVGSSSWALTSGGAGSNDNVPLPQDTAVIDNNTALTGTLTLSGGISSLDCSARTTGITLSHANNTVYYGSYILGSGVTVSGTGAQTFTSIGTASINGAGKTLTFPIVVNAPFGTFQLGGAVTASNTLTFTQGTLDLNSYNLTVTTVDVSNSNIRTLAMGSGTFTVTGSGSSAWNFLTTTNFSSTGTGTIKFTSAAAKTFNTTGSFINSNVTLDQGGTGTLTIRGFNTFKDITNTASGATTIVLDASTTQTVQQFTATGTAGNILTIQGGTAGTLVLTGASKPDLDYLIIDKIAAYSLTDTWYAGTNSTSRSMLGWYFEAAPTPPVGGTGAMFFMFM